MNVLVADDDPTTAMVVATAVSRSGHQTTTVADGEQAWQHYLEHRPDAVLTDRMMPAVDGITLCRRIRAHEQQHGGYTFIVLVTAMGNRPDVLEGMQAGADDYLVKPPDPFDVGMRLLVAERVAGVHARLEELTDNLEAANHSLANLARTDPLTQLGNRLRLTEDLDHLHGLAIRHGRPYALAMVDVDHFKAYNDHAGHTAGDQALCAVAAILQSCSRRGDRVYRYGGEEMLVTMPDTTADHAHHVAERLRSAVEAGGLLHPGRPDGRDLLTVSVGVACHESPRHDTPHEIVRRADQALYAAKDQGRNAVTMVAT